MYCWKSASYVDPPMESVKSETLHVELMFVGVGSCSYWLMALAMALASELSCESLEGGLMEGKGGGEGEGV